MAVRAITFDFWCTLLRDANSVARQQLRIDAFFEATGVPKDRVDEALKVAWKEFDRHHREEQSTLYPIDAVRIAADALGIAVEPDTARELAEVFATAILTYSPEPIEGAIEIVRAAAARVPVGIISDAGVSPGRSLRQLLERHGILDYFRVLKFSDEIGVAKPQWPMFETAAQGLGVQPHEMLHIGDLEYSDIDGARAFGAQSALFAGDNPRFLDSTKADYVFRSWRECLVMLDTLCGG
jgi:putative hydrolase of the HAD superfamily